MSVSFSGMAELRGLGGGRCGMAWFDVVHRDQGQAQVARFLEQAVKCGLVGYGAMDDGGAIAVVSDGQPVEPGGPPGIEMPLEADLVPSRAVIMAGRYFVHGSKATSGCGETASPHVGIDAMICATGQGCRLRVRCKPSSAARRTAARRLVTASLA